MRCFIAIDSGGTKTDAVLFEETGHILARSLTQGCNAMDIGIDSACESLLGVLQNLVARIPGDGTLVSIYRAWPPPIISAVSWDGISGPIFPTSQYDLKMMLSI